MWICCSCPGVNGYSDLEFLFLVEDKTDENEAYFEHLAVNVYFLIGNLQETNLKYMNIEELEGWFQDEAKSGFKIVDGLRANAGNIPTGNGSTNDKNIYICTVTSLLERYEQIYNNPPEEDNSYFSGDDSDMLSYVRLITVLHGNGQELFAQLQEGIHSVSQNSLRLHMLKLTFDKDQDKYLAYRTTFNRETLMDAKSEFYRYPSLALLFIRHFCISCSTSTWDFLRQLNECEALDVTSEEWTNFHLYLCLSIFIRMAAYLFLDGQNEKVSALQPSKTITV